MEPLYKVEVIKMLLKNGEVANVGDILTKNQIHDVEDLLNRGYISLITEKSNSVGLDTNGLDNGEHLEINKKRSK